MVDYKLQQHFLLMTIVLMGITTQMEQIFFLSMSRVQFLAIRWARMVVILVGF